MIAKLSKAYNVTIGIWQVIILISLGFYLHLRRSKFVSADNLAYVPSEQIFLDCGSSAEKSLLFDGRNWSTDIGSDFTAYNSDSNSTVSSASIGTAVPRVPYMTARLFYSKFSYTFNVTPGPKFIRLYFYPDSYRGLNVSESFLTVTSGHYTLLRNFSCYLTAKYLNAAYFFKEFIIHVENHTLELTFSPTLDAPNAYGFVNGIEVVSMPLHLYIRGHDVPLPFIGFLPKMIMFNNNSALETVYRATMGGQTISSAHDTGMFRTWDADETYIFGAAYGQIDIDITLSIQYSKTVPAYTAPGDVYHTARSMGQYNEINRNYNLSWFFPVDTGFKYLIRLHFCEIVPGINLENQRVFFIFINNQTAESQADVIVWSKGHGIPVYRDYVVMIPPQVVGKQDLWLELHPNIQSKPDFYDAILNGVEIFKISDYNGNLAGLNAPLDESNVQPSPAPFNKSKKGLQKQIKYSLKVLSGRSAPINLNAENDENVGGSDDYESLIPSASYCLEKGDADKLVDQHLKGKIPPESLRNFVKVTKQCLAKNGVKRPSISEVLYNLEQLQVRGGSDSNASPKGLFPQSSSDLMLGVEFSEIMMSEGR
ncbi:hypothetical protein QUC31_013697 [Theobroma cacao]